MSRLKAYIITAIVCAIFGFFFLFPVFSVIKVAFIDPDAGFTLAYMQNVFLNPIYREGLWNALLLGLASTIVTFAIAFPLALASHRFDFPWKKWLTIW